mmetsp:Transcript_6775/g.18938  ORF Transcript_6775/g.18938 Transcript_6775/m.18938 type:complete len:528 (+) Transcript_6775:3-1586(+)
MGSNLGQKRVVNEADASEDESRKRGKTEKTDDDTLERGQTFIDALMGAEKNRLNDSPDIWYLEDIPLLLSGQKKTIVLTQEVEQFWEVCVRKSITRRICAVGSPGVGKSITMMYLIRILLEMEKKVVYLKRTEEKDSHYYVWEKVGHEEYKTTVYPETSGVKQVINAANGDKVGDTYFLCDPGLTLTSCNPSPDVKASVIINASGDDRHWGGREFTKRKEDPGLQHGVKLIFPLPKKQQLLDACHLFSASVTKEQVEHRHRMFGSVPGHLFEDQDGVAAQLQQQETDLAVMSSDMTLRIVNNTAELNNNSENCPRSSIMGITSDPKNFARQEAIYISDHVAEIVAEKHMKDIWNEISAAENSPSQGLIFEAYLRSLLRKKARKFRTRNACGKSSRDYKKLWDEELGGCIDIERTDNMIGSCKAGRERVIYYSYNESVPLVDFLYKVGNCYYAVQVTIHEDHDCDAEKLENFLAKLDLQADEELNLVYTVPDGVFKRFVTKPVVPIIPDVGGEVFVLHAEIKRPCGNR